MKWKFPWNEFNIIMDQLLILFWIIFSRREMNLVGVISLMNSSSTPEERVSWCMKLIILL